MRAFLIVGLLALAGCGADGDPVRPQVSGTVDVGIASGGVTSDARASVRQGPVSLSGGL